MFAANGEPSHVAATCCHLFNTIAPSLLVRLTSPPAKSFANAILFAASIRRSQRPRACDAVDGSFAMIRGPPPGVFDRKLVGSIHAATVSAARFSMLA